MAATIVRETLTAICSRCDEPFTYTVKTRTRRTCDTCKRLQASRRNRVYKDRNREQVLAECREYANRRYREDPSVRERMVEYNRRRALAAFGLDEDSVARMYEAQNGECAICGVFHPLRGKKGLHLDHDHSSGVLRGLLCGRCNRGIGFFKDDPERLTSAISYLERNG